MKYAKSRALSPSIHGDSAAAVIGGIGFSAALFWLSMFDRGIDVALSGRLAGDGMAWASVGVCALLAAIAALKLPRGWARGRAAAIDGCASLALLVCGLACVPRGTGVVMCGVALLVAGCAVTWLMLRWGSVLTSIGERRALVMLTVSAVTLACAKLLLAGVAVALGKAFGATLACACVIQLACLRYASGGHAASAPSRSFYTRENVGSLMGLVIFMALFSVILKMMDVVLDVAARGRIVEGVGLVVIAATSVWLVASRRQFRFYADVRVLLVACAVLGVTCVYAEGAIGSCAVGMALGTRELVRFYLFLLQADIARNGDLPAPFVFGVGWACCGIPRLPLCVIDLSSVEVTSALVAMLLLIVFACAFVLVKSPSGLRPPFSDLEPYMVQPALLVPALPRAHDAASNLASRYNLTPRETEVMALVCAGRSRSYIADTLYISENTVKFHIKNVYRKVGVSSRQDLIDLYEEELGVRGDAGRPA